MEHDLLAQLFQLANNFDVRSLLSDQLLILEIAILVLLIFWPLFISTWLFWRNERFKQGLKWVLLEIKVPREIDKSPRAMEQVLKAIHALRNAPGDVQERYLDGEVTRWYSLEVTSFGGEIHMYVRTYYKQRDLVEAAFFSYYKDVEIIEVDDYVDQRIPKTLTGVFSQGYDMWGTEVLLKEPAAYPIKSYLDFESPDEEKQFDPVSAFLEVLAKVKREELLAVQLLISPAAPDWNKKWKGLVEDLNTKGKPVTKRSAPSIATTISFPGGPLPVLEPRAVGKEATKTIDDLGAAFKRSPGETDVLKAVEKNLSQPAFDTLIRYVYLSPKSMFFDTFPRRGVLGAFNQYATLNMNSFIHNKKMITQAKLLSSPYVFPKTRERYKKQRLLDNFVNRRLPVPTFMGKILTSSLFNWNTHSRTFEMSVESLATVFHPPTRFVLTAPHMVRAEGKKAGPPAGLAIFGDEDKIGQYM